MVNTSAPVTRVTLKNIARYTFLFFLPGLREEAIQGSGFLLPRFGGGRLFVGQRSGGGRRSFVLETQWIALLYGDPFVCVFHCFVFVPKMCAGLHLACRPVQYAESLFPCVHLVYAGHDLVFEWFDHVVFHLEAVDRFHRGFLLLSGWLHCADHHFVCERSGCVGFSPLACFRRICALYLIACWVCGLFFLHQMNRAYLNGKI